MMDSARDIAAISPLAVTVDLVALAVRDEDLCLLLIKRGEEPFKGSWALPGGFVHQGPDAQQVSLKEAAQRVFLKETGLTLDAAVLSQLGAYGDPGRDPRGRVISVAYLVVVPSPAQPRAGGDSADARWMPLSLVLDGSVIVAFDHERIVTDAVERTRSMMETTAMATAFCDELFTIRKLRRVYEVVWQIPPQTLDPNSFRNRFAAMPGLIEQSGETEAEGRGRPAELYRRGPLIVRDGPSARLERPIDRPRVSREPVLIGPRLRAPVARAVEASERPLPFVAIPPSYESSDWKLLKERARTLIWDRGRSREGIHYGELAKLLGLHWFTGAFFALLDSVCVDEVAAGGPMVTVLVTNARTGIPGERFFVLAERLGRNVADVREFVSQERAAAFRWIAEHPSALEVRLLD